MTLGRYITDLAEDKEIGDVLDNPRSLPVPGFHGFNVSGSQNRAVLLGNL